MPQPSKDQALGSAIQRRRKDFGMTQATLARLLGVHKQTVVGYEAGATITTERLREIARVLATTPEDLLAVAAGRAAEFVLREDAKGAYTARIDESIAIRQALLVAMQFEIDALKTGASGEEATFIRYVLHSAEAAAVLASDPGRPGDAAIQTAEMQRLVDLFTTWLKDRISRRGAPPAIVDEADAPERQAATHRGGKKAG